MEHSLNDGQSESSLQPELNYNSWHLVFILLFLNREIYETNDCISVKQRLKKKYGVLNYIILVSIKTVLLFLHVGQYC